MNGWMECKCGCYNSARNFHPSFDSKLFVINGILCQQSRFLILFLFFSFDFITRKQVGRTWKKGGVLHLNASFLEFGLSFFVALEVPHDWRETVLSGCWIFWVLVKVEDVAPNLCHSFWARVAKWQEASCGTLPAKSSHPSSCIRLYVHVRNGTIQQRRPQTTHLQFRESGLSPPQTHAQGKQQLAQRILASKHPPSPSA